MGRSGCSALLAPAGLFDRVSAPVAAPGPVVGDTVPVDAGPDVAVLGDAPGGEDVVVLGDAPGGEDVVAPVWAKAEAAVKSAAEVKTASFVIEHLLTGFIAHNSVPWRAALCEVETVRAGERFPKWQGWSLPEKRQRGYTWVEVYLAGCFRRPLSFWAKARAIAAFALMEPVRDNDCAPRPLADHASAIIPSSVAVSKEWVNGGGRSWPAKHIVLSSYLDQCGLVTASAMALTRQGFRTKQTSLGTSSWPT